MCAGHHSRTGSILAMTSAGIVKGPGSNRVSLEERWGPVEFENLIGTLWHLKEPRAVVARQSMLAVGEALPLPIIPEIRGGPLKRKLFAPRGDVERLGATD